MPNKEYSTQMWSAERLFLLRSHNWWIESIAKLTNVSMLCIFNAMCRRGNVNKAMMHTKRFSFISQTLLNTFTHRTSLKSQKHLARKHHCFLNAVGKRPIGSQSFVIQGDYPNSRRATLDITTATCLASCHWKSPFVSVLSSSLAQWRWSDRHWKQGFLVTPLCVWEADIMCGGGLDWWAQNWSSFSSVMFWERVINSDHLKDAKQRLPLELAIVGSQPPEQVSGKDILVGTGINYLSFLLRKELCILYQQWQ